MILGDPLATAVQSGGRATLDDLFRRAAARRPDAIALADPPDRASFTDGPPQRLTYAEADRVVSAIADRLSRPGLPTDAVVGIQLPNTVEGVLTILGVLRAGMIAAPLPLLWRQTDAVAALSQVDARAIVTSARVGDVDHCDLAMRVAAEVFAIRHVCGFGDRTPDGVIAFGDLFTAASFDPPPTFRRDGNPAAHVAIVTFERTPGGLVPVGRNHMELIAGGLAILLEGRLEQDAVILAPCAPSSFGGLALTLLPWLLTGGTLSLHQPFAPALFAAQCRHDHCDTIVLPGPLVPRLVETGLLESPDMKQVLALWRAPERMPASPQWRNANVGLIDVLAFGEVAAIGLRRNADGKGAVLPSGNVTSPRGAASAMSIAECLRSETGTLSVRSSMAPRHAFPPGAERASAPHFKVDATGFVDTDLPCHLDSETQTLTVTGPPPGLVSVGGYRFALGELRDLVAQVEAGAALAALPDTLAGYRLAGSAGDRAAVQAALAAIGANPLVADAFRERRKPNAA